MGRGKRSATVNRRPAIALHAAIDGGDLEAAADAWLAGAVTANNAEATVSQDESRSSADRFFIGTLESRVSSGLPSDFYDLDHDKRRYAETKALGVLSPLDQRKLVRIARSYVGPGQERTRTRAAEMLILTNRGFVEKLVRNHEARGVEVEVLRQECSTALFDAIRRFDDSNGASFLQFAAWRMRGAISEAIRADSRLVRLKSRASEVADRVTRAIKLWEGKATRAQLEAAFAHLRDDPQTATRVEQEIAANADWSAESLGALVGDTTDRVNDVLPWVSQSFVRLDASVTDGQTSIADVISDPSEDVEEETLRRLDASELNAQVATLAPYQRRLVELYWGLGEEREREPNALFDGLYVDKKGVHYAVEQVTIAKYRELAAAGQSDIEVTPARQKQLDRGYKSGELSYVPMTEEAKELFELSKLANLPVRERAELENEYQRDGRLSAESLARLADLPGKPPSGRGNRLELQHCYARLGDGLSGRSGEPEPEPRAAKPGSATRAKRGARVGLPHLIEAGLLAPGESMRLTYKGREYGAEILADGRVKLIEKQGRVFRSLSTAAEMAKGVTADPGWDSWLIERDGNWVPVASVRASYTERLA